MGIDQSKLEPTRWLEESRDGVLLCQALPFYIVAGYQDFQRGACCGQGSGGWHVELGRVAVYQPGK